uniref:Lgl_C domain-containing protein n=1 Tax=Macrostomum lignano TaxID=282301 RepID=A0A1I8ICF8_9PLAT
LQALYRLRTSKYFESSSATTFTSQTSSTSTAAAATAPMPTSSRAPPSRQASLDTESSTAPVGSEDSAATPASSTPSGPGAAGPRVLPPSLQEESPHAVQLISLAADGQKLLLSANGYVCLLAFNRRETCSEISELWVTQAVKRGKRRWSSGYQPELICRLATACPECQPAPILTAKYSAEYQILAIGNENGVGLIDSAQGCLLLTLCTPDLHGTVDAGVRNLRSPSYSKKDDRMQSSEQSHNRQHTHQRRVSAAGNNQTGIDGVASCSSGAAAAAAAASPGQSGIVRLKKPTQCGIKSYRLLRHASEVGALSCAKFCECSLDGELLETGDKEQNVAEAVEADKDGGELTPTVQEEINKDADDDFVNIESINPVIVQQISSNSSVPEAGVEATESLDLGQEAASSADLPVHAGDERMKNSKPAQPPPRPPPPQPRRPASLVATEAAEVAPAPSSDAANKTDNFSRSCSSSTSSLEHCAKESVMLLSFASAHLKKTDTQETPTLWIGTSLGAIFPIRIQLPSTESARSAQPVVAAPSGTVIRMLGAIQDVSILTAPPPTAEDTQLICLCSDKQVRVLCLPSLTCCAKKKLTETSTVAKAAVSLVRGYPCLVCLLANGHIVVNSLPGLKPLMDVDYAPFVDFRFSRTFQCSNHGHAVYFCSPSEVQKITICSDICNDLNDMLADLYTPCDLPEPPKKSLFEKFGQNLFGSASAAPVDREQIFGEAAGKPTSGICTQGLERGEKLGELDEQTERMRNSALEYRNVASQLAQKYKDKDKKFWQF